MRGIEPSRETGEKLRDQGKRQRDGEEKKEKTAESLRTRVRVKGRQREDTAKEMEREGLVGLEISFEEGDSRHSERG